MAIMQDESWDPSTLSAPDAKHVPNSKYCGDDVPFGDGKELIVDVPVDPRGVTDVYIDDTIGLCVDLPETNNAERLKNAILLAIHAAARPVHKEEPIPRDGMAALTKLLAEARLA